MPVKKDKETFLCADIGGTNSNLSIVDFNAKKPKIKLLERYSTRKKSNINGLIEEFLKKADEKGFSPKKACFAIAGPIDHEQKKARLTNVSMSIDAEKIRQKFKLKRVILINDFEAISYAVNVLEKDDCRQVQKGKALQKKTKCVVGAGTGLGKGILYFDMSKKAYLPLASEGGHSDLPVYDINELSMAVSVMKLKSIKPMLEYEDIVSGKGLEALYMHYTKRLFRKPKKLSARNIAERKEKDAAAKKAFESFAKIYARCCRNFCLDTLALSGLYIAGGISEKNPGIFGKDFIKEFTRHSRPRFRRILQEIPIYLITNYDVSLYGCAFALKIQEVQ